MVADTKPCSCGKTLRRKTSLSTFGVIYQHGENPEHVLIVPTVDMLRHEVSMDVHEWCERIHKHESGDGHN